jgi:hypothetical protein
VHGMVLTCDAKLLADAASQVAEDFDLVQPSSDDELLVFLRGTFQEQRCAKVSTAITVAPEDAL